LSQIKRNLIVNVDGLAARDPLKITATITKDRKSDQPDFAEIEVYNLSDATRTKWLEGKRVEVYYGYGTQEELIYSGDIQVVTHRKETTDWITTIMAGDGATVLQQAIINKAYKEPMSARELIEDIAKTSGLAKEVVFTPGVKKEKREIRGSTRVGSAAKEVRALAIQNGWTWNIQNGRLVIAKNDEGKEMDAWIISPETGMQGSPELISEGKNLDGGTPKDGIKIKVKTIPFPSMEPSDPVRVKTEALQGRFGSSVYKRENSMDALYIIERLTHRLDSREGTSYTEIIGRPTNV
jgi:hypothetical protein